MPLQTPQWIKHEVVQSVTSFHLPPFCKWKAAVTCELLVLLFWKSNSDKTLQSQFYDVLAVTLRTSGSSEASRARAVGKRRRKKTALFPRQSSWLRVWTIREVEPLAEEPTHQQDDTRRTDHRWLQVITGDYRWSQVITGDQVTSEPRTVHTLDLYHSNDTASSCMFEFKLLWLVFGAVGGA